jgi:hypothetical protein
MLCKTHLDDLLPKKIENMLFAGGAAARSKKTARLNEIGVPMSLPQFPRRIVKLRDE